MTEPIDRTRLLTTLSLFMALGGSFLGSFFSSYHDTRQTQSALEHFNQEMRGEFQNTHFYRAALERKFSKRFTVVENRLTKMEATLQSLVKEKTEKQR